MIALLQEVKCPGNMSDIFPGGFMSADGLARLAELKARVMAKRKLETRALRKGAKHEQRRYIQDKDAEIAAVAERRRRIQAALATEGMDGERFRYLFNSLPQAVHQSLRGKSLDEVRRWIDERLCRNA